MTHSYDPPRSFQAPQGFDILDSEGENRQLQSERGSNKHSRSHPCTPATLQKAPCNDDQIMSCALRFGPSVD